MRYANYGITILCTILFALTAACDSGPNDSDNDDTDELGSGTLTVMGETWEFEVYHCAFSPEEAGNANVLFTLSGRNTELDLNVDATRQIGFNNSGARDEDATPITSISFVIGDVTDPELNLQANWGPDGFQDTDFLNVDGNKVTATALFTNETDGDALDENGNLDEHTGTFDATCPSN